MNGLSAGITVAALSSMVLFAGCQTPGRITEVTSSTTCPTCETQVRTLPLVNLTYRKHVCPSCKEVRDVGESSEKLWFPDVIHVCDRCEAMVDECLQCRAEGAL